MGMKNSDTSYGSVTKFFHWTIALTIYGMIAVGYLMGNFEDGSTKDLTYTTHKSIGLTILLLVIVRFIWRQFNKTPARPDTMPTWQRIAAQLVHYGLYLVLILMPLSGWFMSTAAGYYPSYFGLITLPMPGVDKSESLAKLAHSLHEIFAITLICLIVIHVLAALKHHFVDKDNVLKSMLPCTGKCTSSTPESQQPDEQK